MRFSICMRLALAALFASGCACGNGKRPPASQTPAPSTRPNLRLALITDLDGYLEPCGCQSRPLGGIDRTAAQLKQLRADGVPTLLLEAGNLLFAPESEDPKLDGADAEAKLQRAWQAEVLAKILSELGLAAAVPGPADLRDPQALRALASEEKLPLFGVALAGAEQSTLIARGSLRVGVFGIAADDDTSRLPALAASVTQSLRARGAAIVIGLLRADARSARRIAGSVKGLDFLLVGGNEIAEVAPPERIGETSLLHASRQGHGLLVVELTRIGPGAFTDVSSWTETARKQALERSASELSARVADWKRDPSVDRKELAQQEARLAALHAEASAAPPPATGNVFSARFVELDKTSPRDPEVRALLDAHDKRVNQHTRDALANVLPKPAAKGEPAYVGSERCGACHESEFAWWQKHPHGNAYATLESRNAEYNLSCVGCHVTGYNQAGGSTVVHNRGLTNVGCESCHGPGSMHAKNADVDETKNVHREVPEAVCKGCHNPEHSDRFEYASYRDKLIVKGHGLPLEHTD